MAGNKEVQRLIKRVNGPWGMFSRRPSPEERREAINRLKDLGDKSAVPRSQKIFKRQKHFDAFYIKHEKLGSGSFATGTKHGSYIDKERIFCTCFLIIVLFFLPSPSVSLYPPCDRRSVRCQVHHKEGSVKERRREFVD